MDSVQQTLHADLEQTRLVPPDYMRQAAVASHYAHSLLNAIN